MVPDSYVPLASQKMCSCYWLREVLSHDRPFAKLYQFSVILRRVIIQGSISVLFCLLHRDVRWSDYIAHGNGKFHVTLIDPSYFHNYKWTVRLILIITHDIPVSDYLYPTDITYLSFRQYGISLLLYQGAGFPCLLTAVSNQ